MKLCQSLNQIICHMKASSLAGYNVETVEHDSFRLRNWELRNRRSNDVVMIRTSDLPEGIQNCPYSRENRAVHNA